MYLPPSVAGSLPTAARESREYAAWLNAHGYVATVHAFSTALTNHGPESSRTTYAAGFAVKYAGQLVRDDGSRAEYPSAGITVFCADDQLPLGKLVSAGRAVVTIGETGTYEAHYVSHWNPRETDKQCDPAINPGTMQHVGLKVLTPLIGGDGPKRFYDLRLTDALDDDECPREDDRAGTTFGDYLDERPLDEPSADAADIARLETDGGGMYCAGY